MASSRQIANSELAVPVAAVHHEGIFARLLDETGVNKLIHELDHALGVHLLTLHLLDLGFKFLDVCQPSGQRLLLHHFCFLLSLNLLQCTAPLAADLQHVGRHALGLCIDG